MRRASDRRSFAFFGSCRVGSSCISSANCLAIVRGPPGAPSCLVIMHASCMCFVRHSLGVHLTAEGFFSLLLFPCLFLSLSLSPAPSSLHPPPLNPPLTPPPNPLFPALSLTSSHNLRLHIFGSARLQMPILIHHRNSNSVTPTARPWKTHDTLPEFSRKTESNPSQSHQVRTGAEVDKPIWLSSPRPPRPLSLLSSPTFPLTSHSKGRDPVLVRVMEGGAGRVRRDVA